MRPLDTSTHYGSTKYYIVLCTSLLVFDIRLSDLSGPLCQWGLWRTESGNRSFNNKGARRIVPPPLVSFELPCHACLTPAGTVETRSCRKSQSSWFGLFTAYYVLSTRVLESCPV